MAGGLGRGLLLLPGWTVLASVGVLAVSCAPAKTPPPSETIQIRPAPMTRPAVAVKDPPLPVSVPPPEGVHVTVPASRPTVTPDPWPVPDGRFLVRVRAKGVQVYRAEAATDGAVEWKPAGPDAVLTDSTGQSIGHVAMNGDGVTWEASDGGAVAGKRLRDRPSPNPDSIPETQFSAKSEPRGAFAGAAWVEQLNTMGGQPPADPPPAAGAEVRSPFAAEFVFYSANP